MGFFCALKTSRELSLTPVAVGGSLLAKWPFGRQNR